MILENIRVYRKSRYIDKNKQVSNLVTKKLLSKDKNINKDFKIGEFQKD